VYEQVAREFPGTAAAAAAPGKAAAIRQKLEMEAKLKSSREAFNETRAKIEAARKEMALGRAIQLAKLYSEDERVPAQVRAAADALLADLRTQAKAYKERLKTEADRFLAAGDYQSARNTWAKVKAIGIDAYTREAQNAIEGVDKAEREKLEASLRAHRAFWPQFVAIVRSKGRSEAATFADKAIKDDAFSKVRSEIEWDKKLLPYLDELDKDAIEGLKALKGTQFTLGGMKGTITEVNERRVTLGSEVSIVMEIKNEAGTIPMTRKFEALPPEDRLALAGYQWKRTGKNAAIIRAVHEMCLQSDFESARSDMKLAGLSEADTLRLSSRIDYLVRETKAMKLLDAARTATKLEDWTDAAAHCESIQGECGDTWFAGQNAKEVEEILQKATTHLLEQKLSARLRGSVRLLSDNRWRLEWNFDTAQQLADFEAAEPPATKLDKAKEPIVRDGMLVMRGLDRIARPIFRGAPLHIEYKLKLVSEKAPHGYGRVLLLDRNRPQPYMWEFAYCHGKYEPRKPAGDYFRNMFTFAGKNTDWWQWPYSGGRLERNQWQFVKCDITERLAKVEFNRRMAYDSSSIITPMGNPDPAAKPDLAGFYQVQFSAWDPDDVWVFDDIIIEAPIDLEWLKTFVEQ